LSGRESERGIEDDFNRLICEVKNSLALQQAMYKLLDMPARDRQRLADNARHDVQENFDEGLVVEAAMQVISGLVAVT